MLKEETFLSRIADMGTGESEYKLAIKLPRMSFEITSMSYDPTRQLPKINTMSKAIQNSVYIKTETLFCDSLYYRISIKCIRKESRRCFTEL